MTRKAYPSDVSDDEWAFAAPYLTVTTEDAPQRVHDLFNGLRWLRAGVFEAMVHDLRQLLRLAEGRTAQPSAAILDSRTLQSSPESGERAGYDGAKRRRGSKVHVAVDTLGLLLALHVTAADQQDRAQVEQLAPDVQTVTGDTVQLAYVDQGFSGDEPAQAAAQHGIQLEVVKLPQAKKGFVLLPRVW